MWRMNGGGALVQAERAEEDEIFAAAVWKQMVALALTELEEEKVQGGSRKGKAPNVDRPFAETHTRFLLKYFGRSTRFDRTATMSTALVPPRKLSNGPFACRELFLVACLRK
jgi:hypothetical protein